MYAQAPNASCEASEKTHSTGASGVSGGSQASPIPLSSFISLYYITWKFIVPVKTSLPQLLQTYFGSDDKCCCESDGVIEAGNLTEKYFLGHLYSIVY